MATVGPVNVGMPPDPERFHHWKEYATSLSAFFAGQAQVVQGVQPTAIQLVHVDTQGSGARQARALEDGILVFDPNFGVMVSINGEWLPIFAGEAFGGMRLNPSAAPVAGANITTTWQKITQFDQLHLPRIGITFDTATDSFIFTRTGVYFVALNLQLTHNNSGAGRILDVRFLFNGVPVSAVAVRTTVGATTTTTSIIAVTTFNVVQALIGALGTIEISAPSGDVTSVSWRLVNFVLHRLSPVTPGVTP